MSTTPPSNPTAQQADLPPDAAADRALALLGAGVPLSLLLDLAAPVPSTEVYAAEGGDAGWLRTA